MTQTDAAPKSPGFIPPDALPILAEQWQGSGAARNSAALLTPDTSCFVEYTR